MKREEYYMQRKVLFEIVKQMRFREGAFLQKIPQEKYKSFAVRQINAWNIELMLRNMERFEFLKYPMNMYYSLAKYSSIPMASFDPQKRREDYRKWAKEWKNNFIGMDFAFDIDNKNLKKALEDTKKIKKFFDERNIPYKLAFSGNKGFHIEIPQENIVGIKEPDEWVLAYQSLVEIIKRKLKVKSLDSSITDAKRIFKVKYSWDVKTGLICLPLTDEQLENFTIDIVTPENVIKISNLGFRGLLIRNPNSKIHFYEFIKSLKNQ
jgi:DNA primase catalytic subunit